MSYQDLGKLLAILYTELDTPAYIDKLSHASSKDLAIYRIEEALRDYLSLVKKGLESEATRALAETIDYRKIEEFLIRIKEARDIAELRELISLVTAYALSEAARIRFRESKQTQGV